jgi:hypothetical protein
MPRTTRFPDVPNQVHVATVHYDFSLDGGVEGEIVLPGQFPAGALFINGICHILESLAGVGTTIGLKIGDADIVAGEVVANWDVGLKVTDVLNAENGYNPALLDEDNHLSIVIAGGDLTAGKVAVHLIYIMSPAEPVQLMALSAPEEEVVVEDTAPPDEVIEETPAEEPVVEEAAFEEQPQRRSHHRKRDEE